MWGCPWCGFGYGGWWGALWSLFWLVLIVLAVYFLVRALTRPTGEAERRDAALEILRARYARGEIDKETFERMRRDLEDA